MSNEKTLNIIEFIPVGHDNGISPQELAVRCGLDDRMVRKEIEEARLRRFCILNMQDGKGYFQPAENEAELVVGWLRIQTSRVMAVKESCKSAKLWLSHHGLNSSGEPLK